MNTHRRSATSLSFACLLSVGIMGMSSPAFARTCATIYEHRDFKGERRGVSTGRDAFVGNLWNDVISSVRVKPGCVLNVWKHANYRGPQASFSGDVPYVGSSWNDEISSYTCSCR
jgi:hypothetical protein